MDLACASPLALHSRLSYSSSSLSSSRPRFTHSERSISFSSFTESPCIVSLVAPLVTPPASPSLRLPVIYRKKNPHFFRSSGANSRSVTLKSFSYVIASAGYGLKEYGAPRPYQTPSSPVPSNPSPAEDGGSSPEPSFWAYGSPADYSTPVKYGSPKRYAAPFAYGPGTVAIAGVEVVGETTGIDEQDFGDVGATFADIKNLEGDTSGGQGGLGGDGSGGGGGGGGGGNGNGGEGGQEEGSGDGKMKLSMSQKLTLAYAVLVGLGGVIGFAKSGSSKSLLSGGGSALILYYVYLNLPSNPVLASSIGVAVSGLLLFVMGSRYKNSGKVFPAGVVSLVSLIMAGGYIHGILRSSHA